MIEHTIDDKITGMGEIDQAPVIDNLRLRELDIQRIITLSVKVEKLQKYHDAKDAKTLEKANLSTRAFFNVLMALILIPAIAY